MKTFFGGTFIEKKQLEEVGIYYPIKLEYYIETNEDIEKEHKLKYGISIVKTEYINEEIKVKTKYIKYVTNDEKEQIKILKIFKENQVTPINAGEIISDLFRFKNQECK